MGTVLRLGPYSREHRAGRNTTLLLTHARSALHNKVPLKGFGILKDTACFLGLHGQRTFGCLQQLSYAHKGTPAQARVVVGAMNREDCGESATPAADPGTMHPPAVDMDENLLCSQSTVPALHKAGSWINEKCSPTLACNNEDLPALQNGNASPQLSPVAAPRPKRNVGRGLGVGRASTEELFMQYQDLQHHVRTCLLIFMLCLSCKLRWTILVTGWRAR